MNVYQENGYQSRDHYLECLAEDYDVRSDIVFHVAEFLGPEEDFDGLITSLQEYSE